MLLTIITVNKNSNNLIEKTSKSVISLLKKRKDISWLIIDSKSKDKSFKIIKDILKEKKELEIKAIIEKDNGIYNAMNKGIEYVKSKYLLFINNDCECLNDVLKPLLKYMEDNDNVGLLTGKVRGLDGKYTGTHKLFPCLKLLL